MYAQINNESACLLISLPSTKQQISSKQKKKKRKKNARALKNVGFGSFLNLTYNDEILLVPILSPKVSENS